MYYLNIFNISSICGARQFLITEKNKGKNGRPKLDIINLHKAFLDFSSLSDAVIEMETDEPSRDK